MRASRAGARGEGRIQRYPAVIDSAAHKAGKSLVRARPVGVDMAHPASRLRGSGAFIAFTTGRCRKYPLIVQGAGAATAAGVLAGVSTLAKMLRGK